MRIGKNAALVVIDMQKGFDYPGVWGERNNPGAERNIAALCDMWQDTGRPIVCVRHTANRVFSPFAPWSPGRGLKPALAHVRFNVTIEKTVNSAFLGAPDLNEWLVAQQVRQLIIVGIQTNMCVESTARMAANLGYDVMIPLDATYTFDMKIHDYTVSADELARVTAANLAGGGFARVVATRDLLGGFTPAGERSGADSADQEVVAGGY